MRFWAAWPKHPRKRSQGKCWERWCKADFDQVSESVISHVEALKLSIEWRKESGRFIPAPEAYLNQRQWEGADLPGSEPEKRMVM